MPDEKRKVDSILKSATLIPSHFCETMNVAVEQQGYTNQTPLYATVND